MVNRGHWRCDPAFTGWRMPCVVACASSLENIDSRPLEHEGEGIIEAAPLFVREGTFDFEQYTSITIRGAEVQFPDFISDPGGYRLQPDSPCIDAGSADDAPDTDIVGNSPYLRWSR